MGEKVMWYDRTVCLATDCDWMTSWEGAIRPYQLLLKKELFAYGHCHLWLTLMSFGTHSSVFRDLLVAYTHGLYMDYTGLLFGLWTISYGLFPMEYPLWTSSYGILFIDYCQHSIDILYKEKLQRWSITKLSAARYKQGPVLRQILES